MRRTPRAVRVKCVTLELDKVMFLTICYKEALYHELSDLSEKMSVEVVLGVADLHQLHDICLGYKFSCFEITQPVKDIVLRVTS